jgi:hypothetical protein
VPPETDERTLRLAVDLFRAGQPLATTLVCAQLARSGYQAAELWCALGSALMASRGVFVRKPFEVWAAKVFRRGGPSFRGTQYEAVAQEWLQELPEAAATAPLADAELTPMIEFLLVNERVLPDAARALDADAAMGMVMILGDRADPLYVPLLREAIEGRLGDGAARSALKRIGSFIARADVQASLQAAHTGAGREELEPYLGAVLARLPAGWDGPRDAAGPAYEGIGHVDVELIAAGSRMDEVVRVLCEQLSAAERDARGWARFCPCVVKRGAMRHDALMLQSALEAAGASVALHGLEDLFAAPVAAKRPWWKFW